MDEQKREFLSMVMGIKQDEERSHESFLPKLESWLYDAGEREVPASDRHLKKRFLCMFKFCDCMKKTKAVYNSKIIQQAQSLWPANTKHFETFILKNIRTWLEEEEKQVLGAYCLMNMDHSSGKWLEREILILYTKEGAPLNSPVTAAFTECTTTAFTEDKILQQMHNLWQMNKLCPRISVASSFEVLSNTVRQAEQRFKFYYIGCYGGKDFMKYVKGKTRALMRQIHAGDMFESYGLEEDSIIYLDQAKSRENQTETALLDGKTCKTNTLCLNVGKPKDTKTQYLYVITYNCCRMNKCFMNEKVKSAHLEISVTGIVRLGTRSVKLRTEIDIVICSWYSARCIASTDMSTQLLLWDGSEFIDLRTLQKHIPLMTTTQGYCDWLRKVDDSFEVIRNRDIVTELCDDIGGITLNDQNSTSRDQRPYIESMESTKHGLLTIAGPVKDVTIECSGSERTFTVITRSNFQLIFKLKSVLNQVLQ